MPEAPPQASFPSSTTTSVIIHTHLLLLGFSSLLSLNVFPLWNLPDRNYKWLLISALTEERTKLTENWKLITKPKFSFFILGMCRLLDIEIIGSSQQHLQIDNKTILEAQFQKILERETAHLLWILSKILPLPHLILGTKSISSYKTIWSSEYFSLFFPILQLCGLVNFKDSIF